jgi:hypothetical protein
VRYAPLLEFSVLHISFPGARSFKICSQSAEKLDSVVQNSVVLVKFHCSCYSITIGRAHPFLQFYLSSSTKICASYLRYTYTEYGKLAGKYFARNGLLLLTTTTHYYSSVVTTKQTKLVVDSNNLPPFPFGSCFHLLHCFCPLHVVFIKVWASRPILND